MPPTLFVFMNEQAAKRHGITADEWLNQQNLTFENGRPAMTERNDETVELNQSPADENLEKDATAWGIEVDRVFSGEKIGGTLRVMTTPLVLHLAGAEILPVHIQGAKLARIIQDHNLTSDLLKNLPRALSDPIALFHSATHPADSLVAMVDLVDANGILPLELNHREYGYDVNLMASAYGQGNSRTKKADDWWFPQQVRA